MTIDINWDTTDNQDLLKDLLRDVADTTDREALIEYPEYVDEISVSDYYERRARKAGLRGMEEIADGAEIPLTDPVMGGTKDWTQVRYGLGFKITAGWKKFNKINHMKDCTKNLGMVMREEKDIEINRLANSATATTYSTGFDGLALASNSHTILGTSGNTFDNYGDAALGVSALQSAYVYFRTLIDDQGRTMVASPDKLMVNPQLEFTGMELLGSEKVPYTGDNTANVIRQKGISLSVNSRLTASTIWALLAKKDRRYDLFVFTSQKPDIKVQDAPDTSRSTIVTSEQWFKYGHGDPRMFYLGNG